MFDRHTLLALVVVGIILLAMPIYYRWISPPQPPKPAVVADSIATEKPVADTVKTVTLDTPTSASVIASAPATPDTQALDPGFVEIETPLFTARLASNAQVSSYILKKYTDKHGNPIALHHRSAGKDPVVGVLDVDFGNYNPGSLKELRFTASTHRLFVPSGRDSVTLDRVDSLGRVIRLTYIFDADKYGFEAEVATNGLRKPDNAEFNVKFLGGVPITEEHAERDLQYAAAYAKVGEELEDIKVTSDPEQSFNATGQTTFAAARSKYFMAAVVPSVPAGGVDLKGKNFNHKDSKNPHFYDLSLRLPWGEQAKARVRVYWGPIDVNLLKAENAGLDETMNWGWAIVRPFSKGTLWLLTLMHQFITNYGVVIIIFAVIVKVVLWPLTRKSQVSMRKMSALQPQMQAVRELHKNNPQAMNAAVMKLYKDNGVNPASGCIPLLFQMPVMIGLYQVFASTIEFRQAPFTAWITDLSQPDVIFTLPFSLPLYGAGVALMPIVMGVTQFFMSKQTVTDPNQKAMVYIMPFFMTFMFNSFPSGLTFYYTLFNVFAMIEQKLIKLPDFTPSAVVIEDKPKKWKK
ncbi:membrane protein insertase YidC [candidate division KSB1 bacterium]|nr:membrane protein insertase YidC [candidate division KSB1 bacterium]